MAAYLDRMNQNEFQDHENISSSILYMHQGWKFVFDWSDVQTGAM